MNIIFNRLKEIMNTAEETQDIGYFRDAAKSLGFVEQDIGSVTSIRYQYTLQNLSGEAINGTLRSYDQSGPFQRLPDMNKIEILLQLNGQQIDHYFVSWED